MRLVLDEWWRDVRYNVRSLNRTRSLTGVVIATLALAIAINGMVITFADGLLFSRPIGVADADSVLRIQNSWLLRYDQYVQLEQHLASMTVAGQSSVTEMSLGSGPEAQPVQARVVTGSYFPVLGVVPAVGRLFHQREETSKTDEPVVLGYGAWQRRFGGAPSVIGTTIRIGDGMRTVIGVAPEGFNGIDPDRVEFWLLVEPSRPPTGGLWLLGRLRNGATGELARDELLAQYPSDVPILRASPDDAPIVSLAPVHEDFATRLRRLNTLVVCLVGAGGVLLLVACANASGLLVNRAFHRTGEIAIRMQLGAGKRQILRQILLEIGLLCAIAGVVAVPLVYWATPLLEGILSSPLRGMRVRSLFPAMFYGLALPPNGEPLLNLRVMAAMTAVVCVSSALSALAPTLFVLRSNLAEWSSARPGTQQPRSLMRSGMVALQVALTVALIAATVLFMRSFHNAASVAFGVHLDNVLVVNMDLRSANYPAERVMRLFTEMSDEVRRVPQVTHVSTSLSVPIGAGRYYVAASIPGYDTARPGKRGPFFEAVSEEYFELLGIRPIEGRTFTRADYRGGPPVVIIDETLARRVFKGASALGHCVKFRLEDRCRKIVGVVRPVRHHVLRSVNVDDETDSAYYVPAPSEKYGAARYLLIRTAGDPNALIGGLRARLHALAPTLPYVEIERLAQYRDQQLHGWRVASTIFGAVGALTLTLAMIGVYSVLAFIVRQRTREIGIRLAIGATREHIAFSALLSGMTPVVIGAGVGVIGAISVAHVLSAVVFGIVPTDAGNVVAAALVPVLAGLAACTIPAVSAARVDPARSLRAD
jgi:putative ABC transport system permease protein